MKVEIKVPAVGEAVTEAVLAQWFRRDGDMVQKDEILFLMETDKVTLEIVAEAGGILHIQVPQGETVAIGAVIGFIETEGAAEKPPLPSDAPPAAAAALPSDAAAPTLPIAPVRAAVAPMEVAPGAAAPSAPTAPPPETLPPSVRRLVAEKGLDVARVQGTGPSGRITKSDVLLHLEQGAAATVPPGAETPPVPSTAPASGAVPSVPPPGRAEPGKAAAPAAPPLARAAGGEERISREPMSRIRLRIAEKLLEARQHTAMLTTFNEIDMSALQAMRARFKESFREKYGVSLGLMSFFIEAAVAALKEFPVVNASIDGKDILYHHYYHIGIAVGADRGLVVPVIRHADQMSFAQLEQAIVDFVQKIKDNRLELADLEGGTFTITNGGVYGSLLSTPILNTPQSGILGMHKIEDRPVAVAGQVVIRPMMYVALSYDHRLIDGRQAVSFLKRIKECIENPERIMLEV
jgi:2-oxoglutarate dehydrogenase E2 component (dihydrolipoamide succinyltransferase)